MRVVQSGFTFVEVAIALLITALLSFVMYRVFEQTQLSVKRIDALMDYTITMPIVYNQIEKDITTLFVPERAFKELQERHQKKQKTTTQAPGQKANEEQAKLPPLKNIFYLVSKEKNMERMSFISTHSLALYDSAVPYNVRIMYQLLAEQNGRYRLTRQETTNIATPLKKFTTEKIRSYDLLTDIKQMAVTVFVPEKLDLPKKEEKKEQAQADKKRVYKERSQWKNGSSDDQNEQKNEYVIPAFVRFDGVVVDPVTNQEIDFVWEFKVEAFDASEERLKQIKTEKKAEPSKEKPPQEQAEKKQTDQLQPGKMVGMQGGVVSGKPLTMVGKK